MGFLELTPEVPLKPAAGHISQQKTSTNNNVIMHCIGVFLNRTEL